MSKRKVKSPNPSVYSGTVLRITGGSIRILNNGIVVCSMETPEHTFEAEFPEGAMHLRGEISEAHVGRWRW